MPNPKLTEDEINTSLERILTIISSATKAFLLDQETKKEWESNSITLQNLQDIQKKLAEIKAKPEFTDYGFDASGIMQAINTDFDRLERFITQHEAQIKTYRAQQQKQQYETGDRTKFNKITNAINGFLDKLKRDEAHLISPQEVSAVEKELKELNIDVRKKLAPAANLRVVKTQIEKSQQKSDEPSPSPKRR